ncbi:MULTISPECIES: MarR family transcriptional regulator [unclassified Rhodococcus (in: high G+C Gram-positive bacteria)]|uniref:MarR family winged helix-turn-helix transcriptional regulator n=2 Tax=unclassified Rhodococcus (in: high G+C Gram-positive bacteria) TaxID=192944 RepID=UPI0027E016DE|nr:MULTISPECIES: MarR family transcriptional regulator [unclassified Rhodococcus (in: high G+C Gram-positive bacteria)]
MPDRRSRPIDEAWAAMTSLVFENRDTWRRRVAAEVDMPFSRVRVLRRLVDGPLTMSAVATAAAMDAPATTVCVNELESRGYVRRTVDDSDRRSKRVTITDDGRALMDRVHAITDPVPDSLADLGDEDAAVLHRILSGAVSFGVVSPDGADGAPDRS